MGKTQLVVIGVVQGIWETKRDCGDPYYVEAAVVTDALIRDKMFAMIGLVIRSTSFPVLHLCRPESTRLADHHCGNGHRGGHETRYASRYHPA